ncbi:phosphonate ABC transporter, permease protein PhnE [Rhodovibrio salinarum]|uniref:Phosphonate ABC transporter, permease protein PhnE n=2 Tax=Rhodovibrio salinarum TaxID=1087 RepID=A0A934QKG2_9PROT|nr:phosphonate ABC transporter, permease protein PhnE [Rhodovibrio salinarum]
MTDGIYTPAGRRVWRRRSRQETLRRFALQLIGLMVVLWAVWGLDVHWPFVLDAPEQVVDLAGRMLPPAWSFTGEIIAPMVETINIATLGTILACLLSIPVALMAAQNTTLNRTTLWIARVIVVTSRSINELVWAIIFAAIFGPGPLAGVVAIGIRSIGFTAKLIAEGIEEIDRGQVEAIEATGANRAKVLAYGILPQIMPTIVGVVTFRWDINIRQSSVIGLVGAGGIGITLNSAMNLFNWPQVTIILIAIFIVVMASEWVSDFLRKQFT